MKNPQTTIAGVLTGVVGILTAVALYLKSGQVDMASVGTGITAILVALGLIKAADGGA